MDLKTLSTIGVADDIVTVADAKNYLRINNDVDDALILNIRNNAIMHCERYLNSDILAKQRQLFLSAIDEPINLPYAPIASVETVIVQGNTLTLGDDYRILGLDNPYLTFEEESYLNAQPYSNRTSRFVVRTELDITYTTTGLVDDMVKQGVLCNIAWKYYQRDSKVPTNWKDFLSPFKIYGFYGTR